MPLFSTKDRSFHSRPLSRMSILQRLSVATNWPVLVAMILLVTLGIVTIWSADAREGWRQLIYLGVAMVCLLLFQWVNYQKVARVAWVFYFLALVPLAYTVVGSVVTVPFVTEINGAHNWIQVPGVGMSFQPAEVMKIAFVLVLAHYLRYRENYRTFLGLLAPFALWAVPVFLILKQPDLGTALVFAPTLLAMLFVAGARLKHILIVIAMGLSLVPVAWLAGQKGVPVFEHLPAVIKGYQRERVYAMFRDDAETLRWFGLQQHRSLVAIGSGGVTGKGIGNIPAGARVPMGQNDFVFSLIAEQLGFIGCCVVIVAYVMFFAAGVEIAAGTREPFGRLVAVGIVALLASQTFLNIAVAVKLFPVTGVTLPFVSSGGSSLIASFMAASILLNIGQSRTLVMADDSFEFGD
jgi:rod shape determining protein RodA